MPEVNNYRNYNLFALRGDEVSDMEVCETMKLDPKLAGTPQINDVAINKMRKENFEGYIKQGYDEAKAASMADAKADAVRKEINSLLK